MIWDTERLSLMTFAMGFDIFAGRITIEDSLRIAKECGVPAVDVMNVSEKQAVQYVRAMQNTGTEVYCYIAMIPFFRAESKVVCAIEKELRIAQQLHAKLLMIVPGGAPEIKWARRRPREEIVSRIAWGYQKAVELSKGTGIQVCFETTPHESLHLSGSEDCREMLERVPDLGLVLDTAAAPWRHNNGRLCLAEKSHRVCPPKGCLPDTQAHAEFHARAHGRWTPHGMYRMGAGRDPCSVSV